MFSLDNVLDDLWPQARPAPWQKKLLKKLFYEEEFQQFADRHRHLKGLDTVEQVLEYLNIRCAIPAHDLEQIPEYGPLVIIANHPTGTLDGLALLYAVSRVRRDVKVVTNRMLTHLEPLSSLFIPVDNIHGRTAKAALQQMFRRRNSSLPVRIGQQIPWSSWFDAQSSARELTGRCYQHLEQLRKGLPGRFKTESAIARPEDRALLKRELHKAECLGRTADGKVIYLWQRNGQEDAPLLRELGRLREIAFRAVGEGSGKRRDIDGYDDDYLHLILWDEEDLEIVGAYRFMPTAIQLAKRGLEGIYSYSLFHYDGRMDDVLQYGIELGRSFIQPRYWGRRGLDYLWSGIGAYLARYPHYRYLFGPVSISGGLPPAARDLLVAFYRLWFPATHPLAESRRPYPASLPDVLAQFGGEDYNDDLARLKSLLGNLGCAIPPLYKQYSEVCEPGGVQFIDFGSDPDFNNCVDGLVLVDLTYLKANRYQRYIGAHLGAQKSA